MTRSHLPPRDIGPEPGRRLAHDVCSYARRFDEIARTSANCRDAAERAQAECDRLLAIETGSEDHV